MKFARRVLVQMFQDPIVKDLQIVKSVRFQIVKDFVSLSVSFF